MKKWIKRVVIAVAALTVIGLATVWCLQRTSSKVATFETAKVIRGNLLVTIAASGTLEPEEVVDVGAQISGRILSFGKATDGKTVDYGAVVAQDAVMAKIDDSVYVSALASAQAAVDQDVASIRLAEGNLEQTKAKLKAAKLDWDRAQKLGPSDALARTTYDNYCCTYETAVANVTVAEAGIDQAKANLAQAKAVLTTAKQNLSYCTITSPVTGTIIDRRVSVGQTVTAGLNTPSLFLIAKDLKRMQVWVSVNEADIARIYPGQPVTFTVDALPGEQFRGEVFRIRPNASMTQNVVTFTVEIFTDNSSGRLRPYLTANVRFEVNRRDNVLLVPTSAVGWTPTADQVAPESQQAQEAASALAVAASAAYVGYVVGRGKAGEAPSSAEGEKTPTVTTVRVAAAEQSVMDQTVTAYGTIAAAPEELQTVSVPFECRVGRIAAAPGQAITEGSLLLAIEPSPDAQLQLDEARSNRAAAAHDLSLVEQRLAMKLAVNQELATAKQAMDLAQLRLDNIDKRAIAPKQIKADRAGIVNQINVREGQIMAAGGTLMELVATGRIEARLGVEPSAIAAMQPGQLVRLCTVQGTAGGCILGHVRLITQKVNPASRLVDVFVSLPAGSPLKLETYVRAEVVLASRSALVVPHSAVLPDGEDGQLLFTVKDGKAVKHLVKTGLEDVEHVEILGDEIKVGEAVIVQGNYEVQDGQAVRVAPPGEKNPIPGEEKSGSQSAQSAAAAEKTP